ncbi:MAG: DUF1254 domain-containing protein [Pseudomonadota bacterium]
MLGRAVVMLLGVVFLATIIHIAAILLVPRFAETTRWTALYDGLTVHQASVLSDPSEDPQLDLMDPLLVMAACRFDLSANAVAITLPVIQNYWSLSLITRQKTTLFTINDRTTGSSAETVYAVLNDQAPRFYASLPEDGTPPLVIETPESEGVAILRILADTPSLRSFYRTLSSEYSCGPVEG